MSAWTGTSYDGEIVVDEEAVALVDDQILHQRRARRPWSSPRSPGCVPISG
jgi:hypothetical protein